MQHQRPRYRLLGWVTTSSLVLGATTGVSLPAAALTPAAPTPSTAGFLAPPSTTSSAQPTRLEATPAGNVPAAAPAAPDTPTPTTPVSTTPTPILPASAASCTAQTSLPTLCVALADADHSHDTQSYLDADQQNVIPAVVSIVDPSDPSHNVGGLSGAANGEIKGRGNYTWTLPKKPYQVKFTSKISVLGLQVNKKWVLLANHADPSLMRNAVALQLANRLGMKEAPEFRFVDLVVNGRYRGNYLLTEKVESAAGRVELTAPTGVIAELDNNYGSAEAFNHKTPTTGQLVTLKDAAGSGGVPGTAGTPLSPDVAAGWSDMQASLDRLDALLSASTIDWKAVSDLIDVDSFVRYYWVAELTENPEITQSSVYFYKNGTSDKLHAGPAWDYDSALRNYSFEANGSDPVSEYVKNSATLRKPIVLDRTRSGWYQDLFRAPQFVAAVNASEESAQGALDSLVLGIDSTKASIAQSAEKNFEIWTQVLGSSTPFRTYETSWNAEVARLRAFTASRVSFLERAYGPNFPIVTTAASAQGRGFLLGSGFQTGQMAGLPGQGIALDELEFVTSGTSLSGGIEANPHQSNVGWWGWQPAGHFLGQAGSGKQLEALQLRLTGQLATYFDVSYRTKQKGVASWGPWVTNGATTGSTGAGVGLEAVQVRLLLKPGMTLPTGTTIPTPTPTPTPTPSPAGHVSYSAHVQSIGWMPAVSDGVQAGTTGKALRMEAFTLRQSGGAAGSGVTYRAHVQDVGWQPWASGGAVAGTVAQSKRLEAFEVKLTGELATRYRVQYRAYMAGIGWGSWVMDGATAGTIGQARRVEAMEVRLVAR